MRKMAYEIRQRNEADYRYYRFEGENQLLQRLDHNLKIADGALRFRIFKVDPETPSNAASGHRAPRPAVGDDRAATASDRGEPPRAAATRDDEAPPAQLCGRFAAVCGAGGRETRRARGLRSQFGIEERGADQFGRVEHQLGRHHREPDQGPRAALDPERDLGLQAARRRQQPPQGRQPAASGSTSPTTSTSPSGARRARTAPTTSPRAARSRSRAASTGASGRPRTAASARRWRSSPTASSSSARASDDAGGGNGNGFQATSDVPGRHLRLRGGAGGGGGRPTTTSPSRALSAALRSDSAKAPR